MVASEVLEKDLQKLRVAYYTEHASMYLAVERELVIAREDEYLAEDGEEARTHGIAAPVIAKRPLSNYVPLSILAEDEKSCTICSETLGKTVHDISGNLLGDVCLLQSICDQNRAACLMCRRECLKIAWEIPGTVVGEDLWWMRMLK